MLSKLRSPCPINLTSWASDASVAVSCAIVDHDMCPSSSVSLQMEAITADSAISVPLRDRQEALLTSLDGEGCLDVASAARLLFPGRCL